MAATHLMLLAMGLCLRMMDGTGGGGGGGLCGTSPRIGRAHNQERRSRKTITWLVSLIFSVSLGIDR